MPPDASHGDAVRGHSGPGGRFISASPGNAKADPIPASRGGRSDGWPAGRKTLHVPRVGAPILLDAPDDEIRCRFNILRKHGSETLTFSPTCGRMPDYANSADLVLK